MIVAKIGGISVNRRWPILRTLGVLSAVFAGLVLAFCFLMFLLAVSGAFRIY